MKKEIKLWLKSLCVWMCILLSIYSISFALTYGANRGWNLGQYHSDKKSADRVIELLTLGSD